MTVSCVFGTTPPYPSGVSESHRYTCPTCGAAAPSDCAEIKPTKTPAKMIAFMVCYPKPFPYRDRLDYAVVAERELYDAGDSNSRIQPRDGTVRRLTYIMLIPMVVE